MPNLHSHAFQRAMAGMTERRGAGDDSFWTWRTLMYRFLDVLTPEDIEAIAALVQVEMLEAGYASVAEFHYLHHQPGGAPYADPAELAHRIAAAAADDRHRADAAAGALQLRRRRRARRWRAGSCASATTSTASCGCARPRRPGLPADAVLGAAPHSLRARRRRSSWRRWSRRCRTGRCTSTPRSRCRRWPRSRPGSGARPVELLLDRVGVGPRWCLIHATQMTADETERLARSGAVAGLCPITEANLGDGIFNGPGYLAAGGALGVGSDSNVRIALAEELRTLEYSQRLTHRARNVLAAPGASVGRRSTRRRSPAARGRSGATAGRSRPGALADLVAIDRGHLALAPLDR